MMEQRAHTIVVPARVRQGVEFWSSAMADNSGGGNSFLGVIVGALLVVVLGAGAFLYMNQHQAPSGPTLNVNVPAPTPSK
jgi:hypothetical protein